MMPFTRFLSILSVCNFMLLAGGCSQSSPEVSETQVVRKGAQTAARVVVGQVVGTPARVAMAAERVAEVAVEKVDEASHQQTPQTVTQ